MTIADMAKSAKLASIQLASASTEHKNKALLIIAESLESRKDEIIHANAQDVKRSTDEALAAPLLKRLAFGADKINDVVQGIKDLVGLSDPVGDVKLARALDEGLDLYQVTCPIGVIGVIFESRPDALVQISTLCLKSGNAVMLKGGSEALLTNRILADIIEKATLDAGIVPGWIQLLETREDVGAMLGLDQYIDLIIPRGSNAFVKYIIQNSDIPVLGHADGICHSYVDESANLKQAVELVFDSKTQYVAVCNALETLLVHESVAKEFLPMMAEKFKEKSVKLNGCAVTQSIIECMPATEETYKTEYLDYEISIKVVSDIEAAINHINTFGSGHTDAIITENAAHAKDFMMLVDSGNVFWNCSTRFSDGFKYVFGAEVGISTNKIHARGPVGLEGLIIYKYKVIGHGHIAADYATGKKHFTHTENKQIDSPYL
ncbi:MAG: glutamate-5-semialdehyde dehydrogenase [Vallitaleaceae bacterium]|jgi:glutamate-5-semialdehyde dehydrogenase|nr:glutamate-5-semialdehyde dehydrogenase [Vallitaleaceae bacterium]